LNEDMYSFIDIYIYIFFILYFPIVICRGSTDTGLTCNYSIVNLNNIKGSHCFLDQETTLIAITG